MQYIQLPDGSTAEFPDDISDEEIEVVLQREYPSEIEPTEQIPVAETPEAQMLAQAVEPETSSLLEPVQATGRQIAEETAELLGPVARGEFDAPTALVETVRGLGTGFLAFADEMLTRVSNTIEQLAIGGQVDFREVNKAAKMRESLYHFEPSDPLARATLAFISAIPQGIETASNVLADQFENVNVKAAIQTVGYFGSLAAFGQVFRTLQAPLKPKPKVKIPKTPKAFEKFMTEERAKQLEQEFAEIKPRPKEELPAKLVEELRETEALEVEVGEVFEIPPEVRLRKAWQAVKPREPKEVLYKKKGRVYKKEPKKVEIEGEPEAVKIPIREEAPTIDITKRKGVIFPKEKPVEILKAKLEEKPKKVKAKVEEKPAASFLGWQETPKGDHVALYNIESGTKKGTTVMIEGLKREGIEIPKTPEKPAKVPPAKPIPEVKETWEMGREEYVKSITPKDYIEGLEPAAKLRVTQEGMENVLRREHKQLTKDAIKEGKIKSHPDYPELGKVAPKAKVEKVKPTDKYLNEKINYGGEIRTRGSVIAEMQKQGTAQKQIDAYMMGAKTVETIKPVAKAGFVWEPKTGRVRPFKKYREIIKGKDKGKVQVFLTDKKIIVDKKAIKTYPEEPKAVTLDTLGLQTSYEVGTKWLKAVKEGRTEKVRQATEQARKEFLTPVEGNPLDKGAIAFLKSEKFGDYIRAMPTIGELKPSEIFKYDPTAKKLIATIETKDGKLKPAIRQSGYHALKEFADSFEGVKDVSKLSATWTDPTRFIQELDQGKWGGMAQKHILWPMRSTTLAKLRWSDMRKASLANIQEKYNATSGKKADAIGDVIEYISTERLRVPSEQFLQIPEVAKALNRFKPKTKIELIDAAKEIRTFFNDLLKAQNIARGSRKQKLIDYRQLYRPWVMERNIWHKLLGMKQKPETIMERPEMPDFIFPDKPPNPRALAREGGLAKYPKIRNIFRLAADYIDTAGRDIFDTNVVHQNKIHSAVLRGKGLENAAEGINRVTAEVYAGVAPRITRAAVETLPKPLHKGILKIRRMLTRAVFPLNWTWNMFIQTSSAGITYARYGNRANLAGLRYFLDPKMKNAVQTNAYSYILKSRWGGRAHYQDIQNSITRNKRLEAKPIEKVEDLFNYMTSAFENGLTGHAITAARYHGRTKLGLKGRELWEYASEGGAKTQSMYNYADLPGLLRAREVGAVTPFQTFSFEVFNTVREMNIPSLRRVIGKTGLYETLSANSVGGKALLSNRMKMLARWAVAIAITDVVGEKAIGRKPWVVSSFIPFVGYIVGGYAGRGPVPHQYIQDAKKGIRDVLVNEDFGRLRKWLLRYHVLAGVQINRMLDGIEVVAKGGRVEDIRGRLLYKVSPEDYLKGIAMGPYRTEAGKEYTRKRRKSKSLLEQLKKKQGTSTTID